MNHNHKILVRKQRIDNYSKRVLFALILLFPGPALSQIVNINRADNETLIKFLIGMNQKQSDAIINYRSVFGPIVYLKQLSSVPGVNQTIIKINRHRIGLRAGLIRATKKESINALRQYKKEWRLKYVYQDNRNVEGIIKQTNYITAVSIRSKN